MGEPYQKTAIHDVQNPRGLIVIEDDGPDAFQHLQGGCILQGLCDISRVRASCGLPNRFLFSVLMPQVQIRFFLFWLAIICGLLIASPPARASELAKLLPWSVRYSAILWPSAFEMKEAKAAARARDAGWLNKTGCFQQRNEDGVEVVLIDTPLAHTSGIPRLSSELLWRVRLYPPGFSDDQAPVYVDPWDVQTYAVPTVPFTSKAGFEMRGDKEMTFKTAAAEHWFDRDIFEGSKRFIPHRVYAEDGGFKLLMGPVSYAILNCNDLTPSLSCIGRLPSQ